jgi:hypothetical protein
MMAETGAVAPLLLLQLKQKKTPVIKKFIKPEDAAEVHTPQGRRPCAEVGLRLQSVKIDAISFRWLRQRYSRREFINTVQYLWVHS